QTLSGAYSLARSTVGQMAVRIALQCSETDSYLILSEDNAAARLLSRPGEAIYNDANGMVEGNSPFQVAWLPDEDRAAALERVRAKTLADADRPASQQVVFEGNVPADLARNALLARAASGVRPEGGLHAWLGEPVAIKDPTAGVLRRQAGGNLLLVAQQDRPVLAMMTAAAVGLCAQLCSIAGSRMWVIDSTPPDDPGASMLRDAVERIASAGGQRVRCVGTRDAADVIAEIDRARAEREDDPGQAPAAVVVIHGLQRLRTLRKKEDEFSFSFSGDDDGDAAAADPAAQLASVLRDGASLGIHAVVSCDTATNLSRTLDRASVAAFEQRAVLQMSASDSSLLIDTPAAGKLGMHRGLLWNEELGTLEKFRPYEEPRGDVIERIAEDAERGLRLRAGDGK
ncbi:MAG: cell division protein FtsK, partial [Planctomycetota bacterium]